MSEIIDAETTAKIVRNIRESEQESPHFQATIINFVWSLHQSDGDLDEIDLDDEEIDEILAALPTDPEQELAFLQ